VSHYAGAVGQAQPWADERLGVPPFINCVAASGVNIAGAATNGTVPTTDAEVQALRVATGDTAGGENLQQLAHGMTVRYGWTGTLDESWQTITTGLVSQGKWFAVIGDYDALPAAFRTPQPTFHGLHCTAVGPRDSKTCQWVDPLDKSGPSGHPTSKPMPLAALRAFCATYAFGSLGIVEFSHESHKSYVVSIGALAVIRSYTLGHNGCILAWRDTRWVNRNSSAPASAPVHRVTCNGLSGAVTTRVTAGAFKDQVIRVGVGRVTLREV
jgi:hypothetical protein